MGAVAPQCAQLVELCVVFDALGDDLDPERVTELDHGANERRIARIASEASDQALVDLDQSIASCLRLDNDDEPVPKSSIAIFTPSAFSAWTARTDTSGLRDAARSVMSRHTA